MKQAVFFIVLLCSFCRLQSADQALAYDEGYDDRPQVIVKGEEARKKFLQKKFEAAIQNGKMKKALVLAPHAKKNPNIWIKAASSGPQALSVAKECEIPYETMSVEEIKALNVADLADENCELYLWTTQKYLPDAFEVLKAWGFKYCQTLTWCKKPMGKGQGGVYCPTTEFLILGRKGKMPKVKRIDTTWWNVKRTNKHSKKPEFFQDLIETVSDAPRLEMFARRERKNWDVWGNEVESNVNLETSANNGR